MRWPATIVILISAFFAASGIDDFGRKRKIPYEPVNGYYLAGLAIHPSSLRYASESHLLQQTTQISNKLM